MATEAEIKTARDQVGYALLAADNANHWGEQCVLRMATVLQPINLDAYDAGLLSDFGGGDVSWWQDYLRSELDRAHDHYQAQIDALQAGGGVMADQSCGAIDCVNRCDGGHTYAECKLRSALLAVRRELTIPAAEYVPAIPAAWAIIDAALSKALGQDGESA